MAFLCRRSGVFTSLSRCYSPLSLFEPSAGKESGALRLLVQLPYRMPTLIAAKMTAISAAWLVASIPALSALVIWVTLGGHLHAPETLNLLFGHLLYGLLVGAIALFSASISDSSATAAIITLAFTIGSWVLDFSLAGQPGMLEWVARLSLTQTLRPFEQGLLSLGLLLGIVAATGGFVSLALCGCIRVCRLQTKFIRSIGCLAIVQPCWLWLRRSECRSMSLRIDATRFQPPIRGHWLGFASRW